MWEALLRRVTAGAEPVDQPRQHSGRACDRLTLASVHRQPERIQHALEKVLAEGQFLTRDLGGNAMTMEFTDAIIHAL